MTKMSGSPIEGVKEETPPQKFMYMVYTDPVERRLEARDRIKGHKQTVTQNEGPKVEDLELTYETSLRKANPHENLAIHISLDPTHITTRMFKPYTDAIIYHAFIQTRDEAPAKTRVRVERYDPTDALSVTFLYGPWQSYRLYVICTGCDRWIDPFLSRECPSHHFYPPLVECREDETKLWQYLLDRLLARAHDRITIYRPPSEWAHQPANRVKQGQCPEPIENSVPRLK